MLVHDGDDVNNLQFFKSLHASERMSILGAAMAAG